MEAVLVVDDDPNVLAAHRRTLRQFNVTYALNGGEALDRMRDTSYAVCVVDMRMPGMAGDSLLARIRNGYPDTIRIVLTGDGDIRTAVAAVNDGHIFRFLAKPCPAPAVAKAVADGIQQYRLMRGERDLLEKTLNGVVRVLTEVLSAADPVPFTHALLHATTELERLMAHGMPEDDAIADMRARTKEFDPVILTALTRAAGVAS